MASWKDHLLAYSVGLALIFVFSALKAEVLGFIFWGAIFFLVSLLIINRITAIVKRKVKLMVEQLEERTAERVMERLGMVSSLDNLAKRLDLT